MNQKIAILMTPLLLSPRGQCGPLWGLSVQSSLWLHAAHCSKALPLWEKLEHGMVLQYT